MPAHDGIQGRSLVPVLDAPEAEVRTSLLVEDVLRAEEAAQRGNPSRIRTVVTEGVKYTRLTTAAS